MKQSTWNIWFTVSLILYGALLFIVLIDSNAIASPLGLIVSSALTTNIMLCLYEGRKPSND